MEAFSSEKSTPISNRRPRSKYQVISYEKRKDLINRVQTQGLSIYRAAKQLDINHSTAKVIVRNFKRNGSIFKRKSQKTQRETHVSEKNIKKPVRLITQNIPQVEVKEVIPSHVTAPGEYCWILPLSAQLIGNCFLPQYFYI